MQLDSFPHEVKRKWVIEGITSSSLVDSDVLCIGYHFVFCLVRNLMSLAYLFKQKVDEALDLFLKTKKMIDELKPDEKKEIYQHHKDIKVTTFDSVFNIVIINICSNYSNNNTHNNIII